MKTAHVASLVGALCVLATIGVAGASRVATRRDPDRARTDARPEAPPPIPLSLRTLFEPGGSALVLSGDARAADGKRVRLAGYMAEMELPPKGAFYIASHPIRCDEAGGGTADLPPDAVRVIARSAAGKPVPHVPGPIEVTGVFHVGNRTDDEGRVSAFELILDGPEPQDP